MGRQDWRLEASHEQIGFGNVRQPAASSGEPNLASGVPGKATPNDQWHLLDVKSLNRQAFGAMLRQRPSRQNSSWIPTQCYEVVPRVPELALRSVPAYSALVEQELDRTPKFPFRVRGLPSDIVKRLELQANLFLTQLEKASNTTADRDGPVVARWRFPGVT